jgi:BirA family transcriptional regulator, biotin operon repressor / biotin---[acetyl-CoA-carboxylase] ligase
MLTEVPVFYCQIGVNIGSQHFLDFGRRFYYHLDVMNGKDYNSEMTPDDSGRTIHWFGTIDSTNARARAMAMAGAPGGTIVAADRQTAGRGRLGRRWESAGGKNLMFSIILRPEIDASGSGIIPLIAGMAVAEAIKSATGKETVCKWPNDVLVNGRKVSGILTESCIENGTIIALIIGIGINVNQSEFPGEIRDTASSLSIITGKQCDRLSLLSTVLERIEALMEYSNPSRREEFLRLYTSSSSMFGLPVTIRHASGTASGIAAGLDKEGGLVIRDPSGSEHSWYAGDVTILSEGDTV